ncbi:MAG: sensor histidine kinase [Bacteroidetes bacterium]|nr:MAG: sensor histidine kinase [Bacteroidota bacterium]
MHAPIPANEIERLFELSELDIDYSGVQNQFEDLVKLAAKVVGAEFSLVNLIDNYTQWSVVSHGIDLQQMPREDSVCQYTIMQPEPFEVQNLATDERFKDKFYVTGNPNLTYYWGVPLQIKDGVNIGALCVLDTKKKEITPEKQELLVLIASEVTNRIKTLQTLQKLKEEANLASNTTKKMAHDIRGPIGGIIGLTQMIQQQGSNTTVTDLLELINLINKSGSSLLNLADEILSEYQKEKPAKGKQADCYTLSSLQQKLIELYTPQAASKNITLLVEHGADFSNLYFPKSKLLQIIGNLISNAIKYTNDGGKVEVHLAYQVMDEENQLQIKVSDNGVGIPQDKLVELRATQAEATSTAGTSGEKGYGFGLQLVKHLVWAKKGSFLVDSEPGVKTTFSVLLPVAKIVE